MYDKHQIKEQLTVDDVEDVLERLGAHFYREGDDKLVVQTICHNDIGEGSHKLYYYDNTKLFNCYTSCGAFDVFDLVQKAGDIQGEDWDLNTAIRWVADNKGFILFGESEEERASRQEKEKEPYSRPALKEYPRENFDRLSPVVVQEWVEEGISVDTQEAFEVKYNPVDGAVIFPHYDEYNRFVGIRQRNMADDMIEAFGKYRPARIRGTLYTSPLSFYLFGAGRNRYPITRTKRVIVFEGEKSVFKMRDYVGDLNNNTVASFGINFSLHQFKILEEMGVNEIVIAFDRQYKEASAEDKEYVALVSKLQRMHERFYKENSSITISFIMDYDNLLDYKEAPIDKGYETFLELYERRFTLNTEGIDLENEV